MPTAPILAAGAALAALGAGLMLPFERYIALVGLALLACVGAIVLTAHIGRPFAGLALLVVTAVALPLEFRGPAGVMMSSSLPLAALLCGVWVFRVAVLRPAPLDGSRVVYATAAFLGVALLAFAVGQFPWFPWKGAPLPAQIVELMLFLLSGGLFLAVGHQITSIRQLEALTWLFLGAGLVACILQMTPALNAVARWTTRPGSVGSLFWTWLAALAFAQALINRKLPSGARLLLLGIAALVVFHGVVNVRSWASGWIPVLTALSVVLLVRLPRLSVAFGLLTLSAGLVFANQIWSVLIVGEEYSIMTRQEAWRVLWAIFEKNPLLGTGPANYYYYTENFPILGWYVRFISHNNYQDLLIQTGALGLLCFGWFAFECFAMLLRLYRRVPAGFARAYVAGAIGGLSGSLLAGFLGDWIIPFYYNAGVLGFRSSLLFWVFLGGALALRQIVARQAAAAAAGAHTGQPAAHGAWRTLAEAH